MDTGLTWAYGGLTFLEVRGSQSVRLTAENRSVLTIYLASPDRV